MPPRTPPQAPIDFAVDPSFFTTEAAAAVAASDKVWDQVAAIPPSDATFTTAVLPLLHDEDARSVRTAWLTWIRSTSPDAAIRDASLQFTQAMSDDANQRWAREDVFRVVDAVWRRKEPLDPESQLCLDRIHRDFLELGLGLQDLEARGRAKEIQAALPKMTRDYISNLDHDLTGLWLTLDELKGVPQPTLDRWRADGDKRWIDRRLPNMNALLKSAESGETRRKVFMDYENRVAGKNDVLLREILELRHELAQLLGLKNWAEYRENYRLVSNDDALRFLNNVKDNLAQVAAHDVQSLQNLKTQHLTANPSPDADKLFLWDRSFYKHRALESEFQLDAEALSEYFPFWGTLDRLLLLFEALFSLQIEKLTSVSVWHPDVQAFAVWDAESETFLGYMYLDPFPRDHKYGHKGHIGIQSGFLRPDATRHRAVSVVVANFTPPGPSRPALLKPAETVSLFHELGHALHNLVAVSAHRRTHCASTPRDFVEIPSIMLEHVFWSPEVVRAVSGHYDTGAALPDALLEGLLRSRWAYASMADASNVLLALFDMRIHTQESVEGIREMDMAGEFNRMRRELLQTGGPEEQGLGWDALKSFCRYRFPIGYAASYYAYIL